MVSICSVQLCGLGFTVDVGAHLLDVALHISPVPVFNCELLKKDITGPEPHGDALSVTLTSRISPETGEPSLKMTWKATQVVDFTLFFLKQSVWKMERKRCEWASKDWTWEPGASVWLRRGRWSRSTRRSAASFCFFLKLLEGLSRYKKKNQTHDRNFYIFCTNVRKSYKIIYLSLMLFSVLFSTVVYRRGFVKTPEEKEQTNL